VNRTRIEWTCYSWNPITGCLHGCWYCYARKLAQRFPKVFPHGFEPTFYPERLKEPWEVKKPSKIFVCSIADLFAPWTPVEWRDQVLNSIFNCPIKHTFQLLTKNPENIPPIEFPENVWLGATVSTQEEDWRIDALTKVDGYRFISFEPLLGPIHNLTLDVDWIIIGKLTGSKRVKLQSWWVQDLLDAARNWEIPVFIKNNVHWPVKIQEFPGR